LLVGELWAGGKREQLFAEIAKRRRPTEGTLEEAVLWFVSYQRALGLRDENMRGLAHVVLVGLPKMDLVGVDEFLVEREELEQEEVECGGSPVDPSYDEELLKILDEFYGS